MWWTHLKDTTPKARKLYFCDLCGLDIPIGLRHVRRVGANTGEIISSRFHVQCEAATDDWDEMDWEAGPDYDSFRSRCLTKEALAEIMAIQGAT